MVPELQQTENRITAGPALGASRTHPQSILGPTHARTRAKPSGFGDVHRKHLHRAAGAPTSACLLSLDRRTGASSSN